MVGEGGPGLDDEPTDGVVVLAAGAGLDTGRDVDAPRADDADGAGHGLGAEPAGEDDAAAGREVAHQRPVERDAATGDRCVEVDGVGIVVVDIGQLRPVHRQRPDQHRDGRADRPGGVRRQRSVELDRVEADLAGDLDHLAGEVVAEHAHREHAGGHLGGDRLGLVHGHVPA